MKISINMEFDKEEFQGENRVKYTEENSKKQLEKDEFAANRDNLKIKTVQGNMQAFMRILVEVY